MSMGVSFLCLAVQMLRSSSAGEVSSGSTVVRKLFIRIQATWWGCVTTESFSLIAGLFVAFELCFPLFSGICCGSNAIE